MAKEAPNDATLAARARYSQALQRMNELSNNPALEDDYKAAVADVVKAETALKEIS